MVVEPDRIGRERSAESIETSVISDLRFWLRRSSAFRAFPGLVAMTTILVAFFGWGWEYDWATAFAHGTTSTVLLWPVLAGLAAHDRSQRADLVQVLPGAPTTGQSQWAILLAVWFWGMLAWGVAMGYAVWRVLQYGPPEVLGLWVLVEGAVGLLAATAVGLAWGSRVTNPAGPLIIGSLVFLTTTTGATSLGLPSLSFSEVDEIDLIGWREVPSVTAAIIATSAAICLVAALWARRPDGRRRTTAVRWTVTAALVLGALGYGQASKDANVYEKITPPQALVCVGSSPKVCGPQDGQVVLQISQRSLVEGASRLRASGLDLDRVPRYDFVPFGEPISLPPDVGVLQVSPLDIDGDRLQASDVASLLVMRGPCSRASEAGRYGLLNNRIRVLEWAEHTLDAQTVTGPPPAPVVASARALQAACRGSASALT
ncbi:MAG: hypothetical protein L0H79_12265 [Intrasporangium sp.]|uniref:hypothetical protein n=1 Tax=Intrasporangium sp. TaxID=1925024 RepID=UPI0026485FA8|nr:hypothetical protein [Intrasporangium sp.]MDN5796513.1 hypothetical protein [Intrasporangium sp.]